MTYSTQYKATDRMIFGINTTELNRNFNISFAAKTQGGKYAKTRMLTGRQLVELISSQVNGEATLFNLIEKLEDLDKDSFRRAFRSLGRIYFNYK